MQLHVLGSAAGGGVPQWNCGCGNCTAAREHRLPQRTQASLAASADGKAWVLFNVTTDIRSQLAADPALVPKSQRDALFEAPLGFWQNSKGNPYLPPAVANGKVYGGGAPGGTASGVIGME